MPKNQQYLGAQQIEHWPLEKLIPYAQNPRTHSEAQVAQIAASIAEFGFNNPILVDTKAGIIAGHGQLLAARKLQLEKVPVIVLDHLTEAQKRAYIIADNQLALNAGWDDEILRSELAALQDDDFNVRLIGFEDEELARLLAAADASEGLTDEDAIPELPEAPISVAGDLWILGDHRLLVGDATNQSDVAKLMAGDAVDLVFTDPPYNVDYQGYTEARLKIKGDRMSAAEFKSFLEAAFRSYRTIVKSGASLYVCHSSSWQREFQDALESARLGGSVPGHLGQEYVRVGLRPLQVSARADLLRARRRRKGFVVWRQIAIDFVAGKETRREQDTPNGQAGGTDRTRATEQQQVRRHRCRLVRRLGFDADRLRAPQPEGAAFRNRSKVRRCDREALARLHREESDAR